MEEVGENNFFRSLFVSGNGSFVFFYEKDNARVSKIV